MTVTDPTEFERRRRIVQMPAELQRRAQRGEQVWNPEEFLRDYEVLGFLAPYVVVRRKSDQVKGSVQFTHKPRWYFGFEADE